MAEKNNGRSRAILAKATVALLTLTVALLTFLSQQVYCGTIERREMKVRMEMNNKEIRTRLTRIECKLDKNNGTSSSVPTVNRSTP